MLFWRGKWRAGLVQSWLCKLTHSALYYKRVASEADSTQVDIDYISYQTLPAKIHSLADNASDALFPPAGLLEAGQRSTKSLV